MKPKIIVSVVLTTHNRAELLKVALEHLAKQSFPPKNWELILVSDGSTDATAEVAKLVEKKFSNFQFISKKKEGLSAGRNAGIHEAKGEWVAFTDDDCQVDSDWLSQLSVHFDKKEIVGIEGSVTTDAKRPLFSNAPENLSGGKFIGCNSCYRHDILKKIKGYDTRFFWVRDDSDIAFRVMEWGTIVFEPRASVYHPARPTSPIHILQRLSIVQSDILLFYKHPHKFLKNIGFPNRNNWIRSLGTAAILAASVSIHPAIFLAFIMGESLFYARASFSLTSIVRAAKFSLTLLVRDILFPFLFIFYGIQIVLTQKRSFHP